MLERTKEILRLKLKVRRLEAKCLRVLGGPTETHSDADGANGQSVPGEKTGDENTATGGEQHGTLLKGLLMGTSSTAAARAPGEEPLVILRNDRSDLGTRVPSILRQLRATQLPDSMATFMPSDFQEAQEAHHQLKLKFLNLQAVLLRWAMKNKKLRKTELSEDTKPGNGKEEPTVRGPRLRELLRLEAAVKAMFTESQLKAIVRNYQDSSSGEPAEKRCRKQQWGEEDLRRMLELRAISSDKVVDHVREKMKIPLPGLQAARLRCKSSPALNEVYKEMLRKREVNQKLCSMCKGQLNTINDVIDGKDKFDDVTEEPPFGRQFVQHVPELDHDTAGSRPKKRRRTAPTTTSPTKKKKRRQAALDWPDTSDSDAELSDPGVWGRLPSARLSWAPDVIGGGAPSGRPPHNPSTDPFGYEHSQRSWQ